MDVPVQQGADQIAERILADTLGAFEVLSVYVGDRLGWYRSLATDGPGTAEELAERTGTERRYAREWLEQQAACGLLRIAEDGSPPRFMITSAVAEAFTDEHSLAYITPLARFVGAIGTRLEPLLRAYRTGGGVSWAAFGPDAREGQAAMNRPLFETRLGDALHAVPDLHRVLARPGARIADVGCGAGWSTIALASAYPESTVTGFDVDELSVRMAERHAAAAGVVDRTEFRIADALDLPEGAFDAAFAFECLHDMPYPVAVLARMRTATEPGGPVVIMDEAVADRLSAPADDVDRLMYGYSMFVCLPDGLSAPGSAGTGTVMRRPVLEAYARDAGFSEVEVLPIEDFGFFRFYRLHR